jgi:hypothetical protein
MVRITFNYTPDEPDSTDPTGMSAEEYERLTEILMEQGAGDIRIERVEEVL